MDSVFSYVIGLGAAAKAFAVADEVAFSEPTAFESAFNVFRDGTDADYPVLDVTGGAYELVKETLANPNRRSPVRVGVRLVKPVLTAQITFVYQESQGEVSCL